MRQIQLWPAPPDGRAADNPWPQWPVIFRTSSSQEEGGERDFALMTRRFVGEQGAVRAIETVRIDMEKGADGRKRPIEHPGSEMLFPADMVILAIGFAGPDLGDAATELGLTLDRRGNVVVEPDGATAADGVYCAGDAMRGASLIVWAIADGRRAAGGIERYLSAK